MKVRTHIGKWREHETFMGILKIMGNNKDNIHNEAIVQKKKEFRKWWNAENTEFHYTNDISGYYKEFVPYV